jgi:hypothetical protein
VSPKEFLVVSRFIKNVGVSECGAKGAAVERKRVIENARMTADTAIRKANRFCWLAAAAAWALSSGNPVYAQVGSAVKADVAMLYKTGVPLDHSIWNEILHKYVNSESRVDYRALKDGELPLLDQYLQQLARPWMSGMTADEQKAALINAYNALTVRWVLINYPVESIRQTKQPFTEARHTLDGQKVSLDEIEGRLRRMGDPRYHAALVCAARSCPPLRRDAYQGSSLNEQLDDNVRTWLANPDLNEFFPDRRMASVSMIFDWYKTDFQRDRLSVRYFLARFGPTGKVAFLLDPSAEVRFKIYHWGLNDTSNLGSHYSEHSDSAQRKGP